MNLFTTRRIVTGVALALGLSLPLYAMAADAASAPATTAAAPAAKDTAKKAVHHKAHAAKHHKAKAAAKAEKAAKVDGVKRTVLKNGVVLNDVEPTAQSSQGGPTSTKADILIGGVTRH